MSDSRDREEKTPKNVALTCLPQEDDNDAKSQGGRAENMWKDDVSRNNSPGDRPPDPEPLISMDDAINALSREKRFMAMVYALRTVLVDKGIVSPDEVDFHFREWAQKELRKEDRRVNG